MERMEKIIRKGAKQLTEDRRSRSYRERSGAGIYFARSLEIVAIALAYLERSRVVRFITAKLSMDTVVEVTARFGRTAGHRLSTILALFVAEPKLLAVVITGFLIIVNLIMWVVGMLRHPSGHHRRHDRGMPFPGTPTAHDAPEELRRSPRPGYLSLPAFILCLAVICGLLYFFG